MNEGYNPKYYFDNARTLKWGENISEVNLESLACGEVFTLLGPDGEPHSKVLMDSHNQIREKKL
ncbi:MAG: hypothetical protein M0R80_03730 [Proteobacteria bacterium]|jgi:hypothetical protein|nr:hypothetical protein [Pseudomonadota bacterium]